MLYAVVPWLTRSRETPLSQTLTTLPLAALVPIVTLGVSAYS